MDNLIIFIIPLSEIDEFIKKYNNIPDDAEAVRMFVPQDSLHKHGSGEGVLHVVVRHDSFPESAWGSYIPKEYAE